MLETMARHWWLVVVRGALAILFGLLALIWPGVTLTALVFLFGAYALVDGAFELVIAIRGRPIGIEPSAGTLPRGERIWLAIEGVAGILAGLVAFVWPGITALVLLYLIAFWAIVTGVTEIVMAIRLRRELENEWLLILGGAASVIFGLILVVFPGSGALALVWLIGAYAIVFGVLLILLGLRLRGLGRDLRTA